MPGAGLVAAESHHRIAAEQGWDEVRAFAKNNCVALAEAAPDRFTVALPLAKRRGRIFLDYLRNQRTHTAIMPYSLRARRGSPVAAPITWGELERVENPQHYRMKDARRLAERAEKGPFVGWGMIDQRLPLL